MSREITTIARVPVRLGMVLAIVVALLTAGLLSVFAVHDTDVMELDGNVAADPLLDGTDWGALFNSSGELVGNVPAGTLVTSSFVRDFVLDASGPDVSYHEPSNKDAQAILAAGGSSVWGCGSAANPTDKDDILNAYAIAVDASDPVGGDSDRFIYFGGERFSNAGTAFMGIWFFQKPVACDEATGKFVNADDPTQPGKTTNDVLVIANFSKGGAPANINLTAYRWTAGPNPQDPGTFTPIAAAADARCSAAQAGDDLCAEVNFTQTFTTPWPFQDKDTPNGTVNGTVQPAEFFEGGINITDAFELAGGEAPACFSSFLMETRSSDSVTATLKDYALGTFDTCGKITIIKDTVPDGQQDFHYTTTGGLTPSAFDLDDDGDNTNTLSDTRVYANVPPGTYTVQEDAVAGYDLTELECTVDVNGDTDVSVDLGDREATIDIGANGEVTCTFTNTQRGKITIIKDTVPNGPQDFGYSTTGGLDPATFSLDDDADNTLSNTRVYTDVPAGSYSVTEGDPTPTFDLTDLTCVVDNNPDGNTSATPDEPNREASITIGAAGEVTCTYTNTQRGKILVDKVTIPSGSDQSFEFNPSYSSVNFFLKDADDPNDSGYLTPGTYSVAEIVPTGWDLTSAVCDDDSPVSAISLQAGETVTCTFTDTQRGKILVDKVTNPSGSDQSFEFNPSYSSVNFFLKDADAVDDSGYLTPGTYSVAEIVPSGWDLTSAVCDDDSPVSAISLQAGETVTCTFTNTQRGHIIVDKVTVPHPDPSATSFPFTTTGTGYVGFSLTDAATPNDQELLPNAAYSVTESVPAGWSLTNVVCTATGDGTSFAIGSDTDFDAGDNKVDVTLGPGGTVECTYTDTRLLKLIIITCDTTTETLVESTVDPAFTGSTLDTIDSAPALDSISQADLQAYLCGLGGASYDNLPAGTYQTDTTIPK